MNSSKRSSSRTDRLNHDLRPRLRCSILGPLNLEVDSMPVRIGAAKERRVLAVLLCYPNRAVSSAQLINALWGTTPPRTARKNLQTYLSTLRKKVGDRISFHGWGYSLRATPEELDMLALRRLAIQGRKAVRDGDVHAATAALTEAVGLWRGEPLVEFCDVSMIADAVRRLTDLYLSAYEDWAELEVAHGRPLEALRGLDEFVVRYPTRERIVAARMAALARCGRASEALAQFDMLRQHLASELGIDPSPAVKGLYREILAGRGTSTDGHGRPKSEWIRPGRLPGNQLPRDIGDFVGRGTETARIMHGDSGVTVVTGEPGVGKTALVVRVAHHLAKTFDDGALVVPFRRSNGEPASPSDIQRELLETAGIRAAGVREAAIVAALWRSWISDQRLLLILDDVADELSVRMFLPGSPSSRVLVTSRSQLSGLESVVRIRLGELSEAEAAAFLRAQLGEARVAANKATVDAILRQCGRQPMALRVVTQRFAAFPHVPLPHLMDRLGLSHNPLLELTIGDLSVKSRYDQWYRDMTLDQRETFTTLGALAHAEFSFDDIVALQHGSVARAHRIVELALESSMATVVHGTVPASSPRYLMSPLTYRFAVQCRLDELDGLRTAA